MLFNNVPAASEDVEDEEQTSEEEQQHQEDAERLHRAAGVTIMAAIGYGACIGLVRYLGAPIMAQFADIEPPSMVYAVGFGITLAVPSILLAMFGGNQMAKNPQVCIFPSAVLTAGLTGLLAGIGAAFLTWDHLRLIPELVDPQYTLSFVLAQAAVPVLGFIIGAWLHTRSSQE